MYQQTFDGADAAEIEDAAEIIDKEGHQRGFILATHF